MAPKTSKAAAPADSATTSTSNLVAAASFSPFPANGNCRLIRNYSEIQKCDFTTAIQQDLLANALVELRAQYENVSFRVDVTACADSPVLEACRLSLDTQVPLVLSQAENLVKSLESNDGLLREKLQASCVILRAGKYLDAIETAMKNPPRDVLDQELLKVLACKEMQLVQKELATSNIALRISSYVPSKLAFDVPVGRPISIASNSNGDFPVNVYIEPVVELAANDVLNTGSKSLVKSLRACRIQVEKVQHVPCKSRLSAGEVGECLIRMRISPCNDSNTSSDSNIHIWGQEPAVKELSIKEARAIQVNAYPPKPKVNVDLYKSYAHGDPGCTITLLVKTASTANNETPNVHIEVFVALNQ